MIEIFPPQREKKVQSHIIYTNIFLYQCYFMNTKYTFSSTLKVDQMSYIESEVEALEREQGATNS